MEEKKQKKGDKLLLVAGLALGMGVCYFFGDHLIYAKAHVDKFIIQNVCSSYIPAIRKTVYGISDVEAQQEIDNAVSECERIINEYESK